MLAYLRWTVMDHRTYAILPAIGISIGLFAATLALGALLHHFVEVPAMNRWSKARVRRPVQPDDAQLEGVQPAGVRLVGVQPAAVPVEAIQVDGVHADGAPLNGVKLDGLRPDGLL